METQTGLLMDLRKDSKMAKDSMIKTEKRTD